MAKNQKGNQKGWDKVVAWYASNAYAVNIIYSLGAAVVIIGALFKIMHWPGAGYILTIGMCTESFLFTLDFLQKSPYNKFQILLNFSKRRWLCGTPSPK